MTNAECLKNDEAQMPNSTRFEPHHLRYLDIRH